MNNNVRQNMVGKFWQEMYCQGSNKTNRLDKLIGTRTWAHGTILSGCPMPVLQGRRCCWNIVLGLSEPSPKKKNVPSLMRLHNRVKDGVLQAAIPHPKRPVNLEIWCVQPTPEFTWIPYVFTSGAMAVSNHSFTPRVNWQWNQPLITSGYICFVF